MREAYDRWASSYDADRNLTRDLDARVARTVLAGVQCTRILELGCGTGKNTAFLAGLGARVYALDFSDAMLSLARAKVTSPHVTFIAADLTAPWPCADGAADLVAGNLVLEHIADLGFIFHEAGRCLLPAGRLFICELHPFRQYLGAQAMFERDDVQIDIPAYVHHISDFLDAAGAAGFRLISLREWWDDAERAAPPRLASFLWERKKHFKKLDRHA